MKEALFIAHKDFLIRLYDKTSFAFLVITPLVITIIMGAVFGGGDDEANFRIPIAIVNYDSGMSQAMIGGAILENLPAIPGDNAPAAENDPSAGNNEDVNLGQIVSDVLTSEDLSQILTVTLVDDEAAARAAVEGGETYCCLVIIPPNFSRALLLGETSEILIYSDPAREISRQIVEGIIKQITSQFSSASAYFEVTLGTLLESGRIRTVAEMQAIAESMGDRFNTGTGPIENLIALETFDASGAEVDFNPLAFLAPSMAIMFLGFGASAGAQSIRTEEHMGTFGRLNMAPISGNMILLGKMLGTFATSALQFGVLLIAGAILFGLKWGDPLAVLVLGILVTIGFTSLGLVLAVVAKDENQAGTISNLVLLIFAIIGGNLVPTGNFPGWLQNISRITPNYWGVQGFVKLGLTEGLADLGPELLALALISILLFILGSILYQRRVAY